MKFKSGDQVRFLNETGGGVVNRIDAQGMVYVLTEDGFEIPVPEKELVVAGGFTTTMRNEPEKKPVQEMPGKAEKPAPETLQGIVSLRKNIPPETPVDLLIGFIPEDPGPVFASKLACYLINDSPFLAYYHLGTKAGGEFFYLASGTLEAETKNYLKSFDQTAVSKISDIHVQVILVGGKKYTKRAPVDELVPMHLVNFSKESYYRENSYFNEKAVLFHLMSPEPAEPLEELTVPPEIITMKQQAEDTPAAKQKKKEADPDTLEVDLHMDELAMQHSQYSAAGILALQVSRFHAAMEEALSKRLRRLVVIHGLGQGILKIQIRKELQEKYSQYVYQDASFKEYGFGATLVHLTYELKQ